MADYYHTIFLMKVFITGGAGFIGTTLARRLVDNNELVLYDNFHRNSLKNSDLEHHPNIKLTKGDVLDISEEEMDIIEKKDMFVFPLSVIKSEVNLLHYPYFILGRKGLKKKPRIEYTDVIEKDDKRLEISWKVLARSSINFCLSMVSSLSST